MSDNVFKPFGDYKTPGPNQEVIELLREALAQAENGECVGVAVVLLSPSGFVRTLAHKGSRGMAEIVGAVTGISDDFIRMWKAES